jgi:hypothetical protein
MIAMNDGIIFSVECFTKLFYSEKHKMYSALWRASNNQISRIIEVIMFSSTKMLKWIMLPAKF